MSCLGAPSWSHPLLLINCTSFFISFTNVLRNDNSISVKMHLTVRRKKRLLEARVQRRAWGMAAMRRLLGTAPASPPSVPHKAIPVDAEHMVLLEHQIQGPILPVLILGQRLPVLWQRRVNLHPRRCAVVWPPCMRLHVSLIYGC